MTVQGDTVKMRSASRPVLVGMALAIVLAQAPPVDAEQTGTQAPDGVARADTKDNPAAKPAAQVTSVKHFPTGAGSFGLADWMEIHVDHLSTLVDQAKCSQLALYLDGLRLEGQPQQGCSVTSGTVIYHLVRGDATTATTWNAVLAGPPARPLAVSVGLKGSDPIASEAHASFQSDGPTPLGYLPAVVVLLLILLASRRGLLRDSVPDAKTIEERPYSLSRCQFAGWLVLIVGAFCLVWISTGEIPVMTTQLLSLLGVTAGTAVAGHAITSSKNDRRSSATQALTRQPASLNVVAPAGTQQTLIVPPSPPPAPAGVLIPPRHSDFFSDILSENGALSVTRLQHAVWTLVLWTLFVVSVHRLFGVLDFDKTVLGLMGISSLTYGAAKTAEGAKAPPS